METTKTALQQISELLEKVTEHDIRRAATQMRSIGKNEKALGTLHGDDSKKLWALRVLAEGRANHYLHISRFVAIEPEHVKQAERDAVFYCEMAEAVDKLFWMQAKMEIGPAAYEADMRTGWTIGVRADWMVIVVKDGHQQGRVVEMSLEDLLKRLGGNL